MLRDLPDELRRYIESGLGDEQAHAARLKWCRCVPATFKQVGQVLEVEGHLLSDEDARGLSVATQMGASLAVGACDLLDADNPYAAAALIRQFVEIEYLLWTFGETPGDPARWINASRSQLSGYFRPGNIRKRAGARFSAADYHAHCNSGGHPSPTGWPLVRGVNLSARTLRADLGQHLDSAWSLLVVACRENGYESATEPHIRPMRHATTQWRGDDPMWRRLPTGPRRLAGSA